MTTTLDKKRADLTLQKEQSSHEVRGDLDLTHSRRSWPFIRL